MSDKDRYEICQGNPVDSKIVFDNIRKKAKEAEKMISNYLSDNEIKWHLRFLKIAKEVSEWSKDPSTKCGAVIVDNKRRIISTGYNGFPRGINDSDDRLFNRDLKYRMTVHSEVNAIISAKTDIKGFTIYSYPIPPCERCAVELIQAGISTVVSIKMSEDIRSRWEQSVGLSRELFDEVDINYIEIDSDI